MADLSYFLRNKEFHIAASGFSKTYVVSNDRTTADSAASFLSDAFTKLAKRPKTVIFQAGPTSFTSHRTIGAIAKGLAIADKNIEFTAVSSFLTYFTIASQETETGLICIPTMRGDYFACEYSDSNIKDLEILDKTSIAKYSVPVYFEEDLIFDNKNLAQSQKAALDLDLASNYTLIKHGILDIDYGYTPEYNH